MKHCKNCGGKLSDRFCAHCGQSARVERITGSFLVHELFHFFTHIEKGFLHTTWRMVRYPGTTVRGFINGSRKSFQPPVSYFLVWTTIQVFTLFLIEKGFGPNNVIDYKDYFGASTTHFAIGHLSLVLTMVIPFQAFFLWLIIARGALNYFECAVAVIYGLGTVILFQFIFALLALFAHAVSGNAVALQFSDPFKVIYLTWFTFDLARTFPITWRYARVLLYLLLAFGTFTLWRMYGLSALLELFTEGHS